MSGDRSSRIHFCSTASRHVSLAYAAGETWAADVSQNHMRKELVV